MPKTGAKDTGKNHDRTIKLGEGLDYDAVAPSHVKLSGKTVAKENKSVQNKAHMAIRRREAGGADPMGDCE